MGFVLGAVLSRMGFIVATGVNRREMFAIVVGHSFLLVARQRVLHPLCFEADFRQIDHLPFGVVLPTVVFISLRKVHRQGMEIYQFVD